MSNSPPIMAGEAVRTTCTGNGGGGGASGGDFIAVVEIFTCDWFSILRNNGPVSPPPEGISS